FRNGSWGLSTPFDAPLLLLALTLPIGVAVSADTAASVGKAWGLALGLAVIVTVGHLPATVATARGVVAATALIGTGIALVALVGVDWNAAQLLRVPLLYDHLPRLVRWGSGSGGAELFNPRQIGGALALLLPIAAAAWPVSRRWAVPLGAGVVLMAAVLALTQTPSAIVGVGVALLLTLAVRDRPRRLLWAGLAVVGLLTVLAGFTVLLTGAGLTPSAAALRGQERTGFGFVSRLEIWQRAIAMIGDYPYSGIGLNTFRLIMDRFYPGFVLGPENHAHNFLLQAGVEHGLPGLIAWVWLLVSAILLLSLLVRRAPDPDVRRLALAVLAGLVSFAIFGVIDTLPNARPMLALWLTLGLAALLARLAPDVRLPERALRYSMLAALAVAVLGPLEGLGPARNLGHVLTARATLGPSATDSAALISGMLWLERAAAAAPDDGHTWMLLADTHARRGAYAAATEALRIGLAADRAHGIGAYAPGEALALQRAEQPVTGPAVMLRVYRQWQLRYSNRALAFLAGAMTMCEISGDPAGALTLLNTAGNAAPAGWAPHYRAAVVEQPGACAARAAASRP
ncbi:MAG: O-antigen ligase family protein, partial [Chloroflexi bacterium]|nr:O-antigen ligase family protein [Chloroflexota bacterium]